MGIRKSEAEYKGEMRDEINSEGGFATSIEDQYRVGIPRSYTLYAADGNHYRRG